MANLNTAFVVENGIIFDETQTGIFSGHNDPRDGEDAPVGSIFIQSTGALYIKTGTGNTQWNLVGADSLQSLPITSKGDLVTRTADANIRLAVGPNTYALIADSSQPTGLKWSKVDHGTLDGLLDDDHTQYVHKDLDRVITAQHSFSPSSQRAPFVLSANAQNQVVTGLNADLLDGQHAANFQLTSPFLSSTSVAGNGLISKNGQTANARSIAGTSGQINVVNGDGVSGNPTISLPNVGTAGTYGSASSVPKITTDAQGRITGVTNTPISYAAPPVTSVFGRTGDIVAQEGDYNLNLLSDTTISSPQKHDTLIYDGSQWRNTPDPRLINFYTGTITTVSGTSTVPWDNSQPQSNEGSVIWTTSVTPKYQESTFEIVCPFTIDFKRSGSGARVIIVSIFRNSINIGSFVHYTSTFPLPVTKMIRVIDSPNTTSPVNYQMRVGIGNGSGTWYINRVDGSDRLDGSLQTHYSIAEYIK